MAYLKGTHICSGIFPKSRVAMAFLNFAEIAMASIQLTLISYSRRKHENIYVRYISEKKNILGERRLQSIDA
jgi:hypothetical protein